jgi:hypothetical protein
MSAIPPIATDYGRGHTFCGSILLRLRNWPRVSMTGHTADLDQEAAAVSDEDLSFKVVKDFEPRDYAFASCLEAWDGRMETGLCRGLAKLAAPAGRHTTK